MSCVRCCLRARAGGPAARRAGDGTRPHRLAPAAPACRRSHRLLPLLQEERLTALAAKSVVMMAEAVEKQGRRAEAIEFSRAAVEMTPQVASSACR